MSDESSAERVARYMTEIEEGVARLEKLRPIRNDPAPNGAAGKVPYKVLDYRGALIWRFTEIARSAHEAFAREQLAVAVLLTRAAMECAVALWYIYRRVDETVEGGSLDDLNKCIMRLLLGRRYQMGDGPKAINVLDFLDHIDEGFKGAGFREQYEQLSEIAHPNWGGTLALYGKHDRKNIWTDFGAGIRPEIAANHHHSGATGLSVAVMVFEYAYARIDELMPPFMARCKRDLA